ncbi:LacI family transcriptional regulator [Dermabacter sp. p3-SID358]|uniref:LacI family DNA-binding transcriptional regulator n=1 Tax=Dermabacter sp. p3-SID358 TaxID=2916114 RepID=UPI0021A36909|nr:LacI family DNA-binding transcriptional regulator [Dermabacter sp. p3-SID358]MCT1867418.1 LacI family transcriptional regulator [Dermabacter sp. p3-SID358]
MAKVRLIDIARKTHVSEATVSRVLAGKPGVNAATRDKVLAAARSLGRTDDVLDDAAPLIGLVVPNIENPIFSLFLERLEAEARAANLETLVSINTRSEEQEAASMQRLARAGARGIVIVSGQHAHDETSIEHYLACVDNGVKLCLVNGVRPGLDASFISTDDSKAVVLALEHLRHLGHERVGLAVGDEHTWPVRGKVSAFEQHWSHEYGCVAYTDFSLAGGYQAALELYDQGCTAMVCGSDQMALGAISAIRDLGLRVPRDMSVVGYDGIPLGANHTPALTTVRQPVPMIARAAVRSVSSAAGESRQAPRAVFVVPPELVVRQTTSPPANAIGLKA